MDVGMYAMFADYICKQMNKCYHRRIYSIFSVLNLLKHLYYITKQWNFENMNIAKVNDNSSRGGKTAGVLHTSNDCTRT